MLNDSLIANGSVWALDWKLIQIPAVRGNFLPSRSHLIRF